MLYYEKLTNYPYGIETDYIDTEAQRLEKDIYKVQSNDRLLYIESLTDDLLHGYYTARHNMKVGADPDAGKYWRDKETSDVRLKRLYEALAADIESLDPEKERRKMLAYYNALVVVITLCLRLKITYSDEFIRKWEAKAAYFPFGDMMRANSATETPAPEPTPPTAAITTPPRRKKQQQTFEDFIIIEDKAALIEKIRPIISDAKAKKVATIIRALVELGYIVVGGGQYAALTRALNNCYEIRIVARQVTDYASETGKCRNNITSKEIESVCDIIR